MPYDVLVDRFSASDTALTVSWKNTGFGAGSGNRIWMNGQVTSITTTALNATYKVTGLSAGVNYVFKIGAYDSTGYSGYSFPAAAITKTSAASNSFQQPHSTFYDTTNMCSVCHSAHMARTKSKILKFKYSNLSSGYSTNESQAAPAQLLPDVALCFNCHDGAGAQYNAKMFYDQPTSANIPWPGHMTRNPSTTASETSFMGWRYIGGLGAGQRLPCMVCHDAHVSSKGNYKMLADGLVNYATSLTGGWSTGTSITSDAVSYNKVDIANNQWEKCTICHHDNSKNNGIMKVAARDLYWPNSNNGTPAEELTGTKDHVDVTDQDNCLCHVGESTNNLNNVHALSKEPESALSSCTSCHRVLEQRMMSSSITSRHYISQSSNNSIPESGTCVAKCHNNHPRNTNTHAANVYEDASTRTGSAAYDYNQTTGEGLCLSCHKSVRQSFRPGGTSNSTAFVSAISTSGFKQSAHNYDSTGFGPSHFTPTKFTGNCIKCHRDNSDDIYSKWGPHASSNRSLLVMPTTGQSQSSSAGNSEMLCLECHSNKTGGSQGSDFWAGRQMATVAWRISEAFSIRPTWGHATYLVSTSIDRHRASEGGSPFWMTAGYRHVECYDCHNSHFVSRSYDYDAAVPYTGSVNDLEQPKKGTVANSIRGVWGVYPTTNWNAIPTAAVYTTNYNSPDPNGILYYTASASKQAYICLKCHSSYAYGTRGMERPILPSGIPSLAYINNAYDSTLRPGPQSDVLAEFNPNNYGYHPIFSPGRNQPDPSLNTKNWDGPAGRNSASYDTPGVMTGLTSAFVPPWGASSLITCSDCHGYQSSSYSRGYYTSSTNVTAGYEAHGYPRGPHGSKRRWLLRGLDYSINYKLNNGSWIRYQTVGLSPTDDKDAGAQRVFCLNCHRVDVYGYHWDPVYSNEPAAGLSRPGQHPPGDTGLANWAINVWSIGCLNCHGGREIGGIHGSSAGKEGTNTTYSAKRLLNGSFWLGTKRATTTTKGECTTKPYTGVSDRVDACQSTIDHTGFQYDRTASYDYDLGPDP